MANTKVTQHVIANNAITADQIASAAVTDAKLHATLDLSSKTLTLPATAIPSASTATTQSASDNSTKLATTAYVTTAIANLNDSAPTALNTLNELAAALNDDASFSSTITTALGTKLPLAGGTMTGNIAHASNLTLDVGGDINLDAAGDQINFKSNGTSVGYLDMSTGGLILRSLQSNSDMIFQGTDGSSSVNALLLDMSAAGFAIFNDGGSFGGTGALKIPAGTTGQRPSAATGQLRWNTTDGKLEIYDGSAWSNVSAGTSNKVLDTFTGNNSTTAFTLTETPANEDALMVFINGAYQEKGDYSLSGKVLTLDVAPLSTEKVVVHTTIGAVHDGTTAVNNQFTATAGQTAFTLAQDPLSENNTQVYINGVYQQKTDYTVVGTTLTFDTGLTVGDVVEVNMFTVTNLGGTDSVTEGVSNLYHTTARARSAISVSGNALSYNSSTGVITSAYEESPTFTGSVTLGSLNQSSISINTPFATGNYGDLVFTTAGTSTYNARIRGTVPGDGTRELSFITAKSAAEATAMTIDGDGFVGIGTDNPSALLNVNTGATGSHDAIIISRTTHGTVGTLKNAAGSLQVLSNKQLVLGADPTNSFTAAGSEILFQTDGTTKMTLSSSGDIAIGTHTPSHDVHIKRDASETNLAIQSNIGGTGSAIGGRLRLQLGAQSNTGSGNADTQAGDVLGQIMFEGQGTDYSYQGGNIKTIVTTGDGSDDRSAQATAMTFETIAVGSVSPAERMRILSSGDVSLNDGNLKVASGHGIDFSSHGNVAGMSSELLDDYEEGTWTGVIGTSDGQFTTAGTASNSRYTKIGNQVTVWADCSITTPNSGTGVVRITGLPFTSQSAGFGMTSQLLAGRFGQTSTYNVVGYQGTNSTTITFYYLRDNNTLAGWGAAELNNTVTPYIGFTMTYTTAS